MDQMSAAGVPDGFAMQLCGVLVRRAARGAPPA
jgi:hypothetical protein